MRSPLVLLQVLALARQYACMHLLPLGTAERKAYGRAMQAHGQPLCQARAHGRACMRGTHSGISADALLLIRYSGTDMLRSVDVL